METLFEKEIIGVVSDFKQTDESMSFKVDELSVVLSTEHDQDCCEHVYGDFSVTAYLKKIDGRKIEKIKIKSVDGIGFLVVLVFNYDSPEKVFIPCYNFQSGYYSSDLSLLIEIENVKTKVDISNLVEDHID